MWRHRLAVVALVTLLAGVLLSRARLSTDVAALLPARGDAAALASYIRAFGGGGVGVVLVEAEDPKAVAETSNRIARELLSRETASYAATGVDFDVTALDPWLVWRNADRSARDRLAEALASKEAMVARLRESRTLLLGPGGGASELIARDPLRLSEVAFGERAIGSGLETRTDGAFATDDGRAALVVVKPKGQALRGAEARAFVDAVESVLAEERRAHPEVTLGLTGPHAVAAAMETMLRSDLTRSGVVSSVLASLVFVVLFRRVRALAAILPPLFLGTVWTAALAALWPSGLSGIAVAFASVVVGVGFDTGVHVYAALLEARRAGLSPRDAAIAARRKTARPVLVAATIAGGCFLSLALSSVEALAQLGVLCAAGEILTAIAIVVLTPDIGAWLERGAPPKAAKAAWTKPIAWATGTRSRATVAIIVALGLGASWLPAGLRAADSLVAVRPDHLPPLEIERRIFALFGGRIEPWIVTVEGTDREEAMTRGDRLAERLATAPAIVAEVDALTSIAPSRATQTARLAERDALDLPGKAALLESALVEAGFSVGRFTGVLEAMRSPSHALIDPDAVMSGEGAALASRYVAELDDHRWMVAMHVHALEGLTGKEARDRLSALVNEAEPRAVVTGYARLEVDLRESLRVDLPRIGGVALLVLVVLLGASLRRASEVIIALVTITLGVGSLLGIAAMFDVHLHIYSALVIPVLLGITVDEALFLLQHARSNDDGDPIPRALAAEGPSVATTALTTSAGFVALAFSSYRGLADLGTVGALGSVVGLGVALVVVPACLRLARARSRP